MAKTSSLEGVFSKIASELAAEPGVLLADGKPKAFGAGTLKVHGKIFAMVTSRGHFVVKLPRSRVAELVSSGAGAFFDPGHGRLMKEWLQVDLPSLNTCRSLAKEALSFVSAAAQANDAGGT